MTIISPTAWGMYPSLLAGSFVLFVMGWKWRKEKATGLRVVMILAIPFFTSWGTSLALERFGFVTVSVIEVPLANGSSSLPSVVEQK